MVFFLRNGVVFYPFRGLGTGCHAAPRRGQTKQLLAAGSEDGVHEDTPNPASDSLPLANLELELELELGLDLCAVPLPCAVCNRGEIVLVRCAGQDAQCR